MRITRNPKNNSIFAVTICKQNKTNKNAENNA